jgi:hypothetical protein
MKKSTIRSIIEQQARLELRLYQLGVEIPQRQPWDDAVTYNNSLLEAVEVAEEKLADQRHRELARQP